uniref:Uncharacterized protein n=1 Tax=Kalanchoe fedtschenkoi TaxID=63787 RepID=A0A7N0R866_KALFE
MSSTTACASVAFLVGVVLILSVPSLSMGTDVIEHEKRSAVRGFLAPGSGSDPPTLENEKLLAHVKKPAHKEQPVPPLKPPRKGGRSEGRKPVPDPPRKLGLGGRG